MRSVSLLFLALLIPLLIGCGKGDSSAVKFAFLTDLHITPGSDNIGHMKNVIDEINSSDVDMVLITGDICNSGSNEELLLVYDLLDGLDKDYHIVPGNHETNWSESAGQKFIELWGDDRFIVEWKDFLFVGFSTGPYLKMGDGHVKREDVHWLKKELEERAEGKQLFSFAHYPLNEELDNWYEITDILNSYDCRASFCGHHHQLRVMNFDGIPGIMGRSLVLRDGGEPGYNIIKIDNDSLQAYEKILDKPLGEPDIAIDLNNPVKIEELETSAAPDYSVNAEYPAVGIDYEWVDAASVFTGVSLINDTAFVYGNSLGELKVVSYLSDEVLWEHNFEGSLFSTPAYYDDIVVTGAADGYIYGFNVATGDILWQVNAGSPVVAAPVIKDGFVYIGGGYSAFYKIDVVSGEVQWAFDGIDAQVQAEAVVKDDHVVFGAWDRHLYNLSAETGELRWKWNNDHGAVLYSPGNVVPAISEGRVFIVAPDRYMTSLDLKSGNEIWRTGEYDVRESMGVSPCGEEVYAKLMDDYIISVSTTTNSFDLNWIVDAGIGYDHNPCPVISSDDIVVGATRNGLVTAIDRSNEELKWIHKVGNSSVNFMDFDSAGNIWLTSMDGRVIKIKYKE
ncbi:PQQ-binding-like beta-propeller repeat protein [Marinilabiliaceae bacterium ANBcel2]|nr:PQQ-binding-like beta-propeller repeat protein [Marinilabiliaceae bacterium ANBcel2]